MKRIALILLCLLSLPLFAQGAENEPLPINQAFQFSMSPTNTDSIVAEWKIAKNYYLYKSQIKFKILSPKDVTQGLVFMPAGIEKDDKILGKHQVYENDLSISVPVINPDHKNLKILVNYQGCSSEGFCYPPELKLVTIKPNSYFNKVSIQDYQGKIRLAPSIMAKAMQDSQTDVAPEMTPVVKASHEAPLSQQQHASDTLEHSNFFISLALFFGFGLLLAFTPCVLPMIPILSGIIAGHGNDIHTRKAFMLSLVYVLSMSITFAIAGIIVGLIGANLQAAMQTPWVIVVFSIIFVLLALSLFGFYELQLPQAIQNRISELSNKQKSGHYWGVAIMGCLATLIVSPCVSAPLVGALAYIGSSGNAPLGGLALFAMGLGMGVPLLIVGTSLGQWLPKAGHWMDIVKAIFGVLMLAMAIWLLERIIPGAFALFLWGVLAIVSAIYMGVFKRDHQTGWQKLWQGMGMVLLLYGAFMLIGAAMGNSNPLEPLCQFRVAGQSQSHQDSGLSFKRVTTLSQLQAALASAKQQHKAVMLDFYADWCVACKEMEAGAFTDPQVKAALHNTVLLQVDVTANNADDKNIQKHFKVIAPPTIIFFNQDGKELKQYRVVGEQSASEFLAHVKSLP